MSEKYNVNYKFSVQSAEDFYKQLREFEKADQSQESMVDLSDLSLAKSMLKSIGVNVC